MAANYDIVNATVVTPLGFGPVHGTAMDKLRVKPKSFIRVRKGIISEIGSMKDYHGSIRVHRDDLGNRVIMPGFVDSHTHMLFGGYRAEEFRMRMMGASYMAIMNAGGGIQNTVTATRKDKSATLASKFRKFLREMNRLGITTVEVKTGYGLDTATESKMLEILNKEAEKHQPILHIVPTYMGAHAIPSEFAGCTDDYVDFLIREQLPLFKDKAGICDVFCEKGVFSINQSLRLLEAARGYGYALKVHADEMSTLGGAQLAVKLGALSADHLLHVSEEGITDLANAPNTVATLLPLTAFVLREPYAPARRLIDSGAAVALASDFNPGSCFSFSIPLIIALATLHMKMTIEETITALTLNGAAALGLANRTGSIEVGKDADFIVLDFKDYNFLPYYTGLNCVARTYVSENRNH